MKKELNILVVLYSQTGQLEEVMQSIMAPFSEHPDVKVHYYRIQPLNSYPFPWTMDAFFNEFPESVAGIPCPIEEDTSLLSQEFDLIFLGYQPWFLSISRPMNSFLQTKAAQNALKGKNIITVIGCRNMWTQAQETMKKHLNLIGAHLVGNIVLSDKAWNLISVYTILRWMLYGKKGNSGISKQDILHSRVFGKKILEQLIINQPIAQKSLVSLGAVQSLYGLTFLEKRAIILFRVFSSRILKYGDNHPQKRRLGLRLFRMYLFLGLLISPIAFVVIKIYSIFNKEAVKKSSSYFEGVGE